jgi:hypothetical protein
VRASEAVCGHIRQWFSPHWARGTQDVIRRLLFLLTGARVLRNSMWFCWQGLGFYRSLKVFADKCWGFKRFDCFVADRRWGFKDLRLKPQVCSGVLRDLRNSTSHQPPYQPQAGLIGISIDNQIICKLKISSTVAYNELLTFALLLVVTLCCWSCILLVLFDLSGSESVILSKVLESLEVVCNLPCVIDNWICKYMKTIGNSIKLHFNITCLANYKCK